MNNPETPVRQVRYGTAESTHLKFVTTGNGRRIAFPVTDPVKRQFPIGLDGKPISARELKELERDARKRRIRQLKASGSAAAIGGIHKSPHIFEVHGRGHSSAR